MYANKLNSFQHFGSSITIFTGEDGCDLTEVQPFKLNAGNSSSFNVGQSRILIRCESSSTQACQLKVTLSGKNWVLVYAKLIYTLISNWMGCIFVCNLHTIRHYISRITSVEIIPTSTESPSLTTTTPPIEGTAFEIYSFEIWSKLNS